MDNEIVQKRKLADAVHRLIKSREPDMLALGELLSAIGTILGCWTGEKVRVLITAEGQSGELDMVKSPPADGRAQ